MQKSDDINELAAALSKFQGEVRDADRNKASYNGKYAQLDQIFSIIRPILSKCGLSFMQNLVSQSAAEVRIQTWIMHSSGQYIMSELTVPVNVASGKTNSLQQVGVTASYAKRYAIMGALGICQKDEDDDADSLTDRPKELPKAVQKNQPFKPPAIKTITNDEAIALLDLIVKAGYSEKKILDHCGIKNLLDLVPESHAKLINMLNKKIEEAKKVAK
jgi:hypothetical protein